MAILSYEELRQEEAWRDEVVPPELNRLRQNLEKFWGVDKVSIGTRGDSRHLRGYHRSRRWIRESVYCTDRSYSITETAGNRNGGDDDWVSAIDLGIGKPRVMSVGHALNVAKAAGGIPYVRQILIEGDPWHVHISFDRAFANHSHDELYRVITGTYAVRESLVDVKLSLPLLRNGSEGGYVRTAQALLNARGFSTRVDGDFGPDTERQTVAMQRKYGAEKVDAIWGPETWTIAVTGVDKV